MRINSNIPALQVFDSIRSANRSVSGSMLRLSSGFKINSARDDAAGLAISNKMRMQIDGLEMASRNSLDGISLVQTADGALTEVHSMLQRMRELAVMAANGHIVDEDRLLIQDEINQLLKEIDEISMRTEFNGMKLFGPKANQAHGFSVFTDDHAPSRIMGGLRVSDGFPEGNFNNISITQLLGPGPVIDIQLDGVPAGGGVPTPAGPTFQRVGGGEVPIANVQISGNEIIFELGPPHVGEYAVMQVNITPDAAGTGYEITIPDPAGGWQVIDAAVAVLPIDLNVNYRDHSAMVIQIGPSRGMEMIIRIPQLNAETLGLSNLDYTSQEFFLPGSTVNPIVMIDDAIRQVSAVRSRLGAYQNRLESTVKSLDITNENMAQALSRIIDTDMAREMTFFTTHSILSQAGISIMAQANQRPQQILALVGQ